MPIACLAIAALVAFAVDALLPKLQVVAKSKGRLSGRRAHWR